MSPNLHITCAVAHANQTSLQISCLQMKLRMVTHEYRERCSELELEEVYEADVILACGFSLRRK